MSALLMGRAFYADLPAHLKFTLVALADHADDDGGGIFVGQERLAVKVGASSRSVRSNVDQLTARGYLVPEGRVGSRGTNRYRLVVDKLPTLETVASAVDRKPTSDRKHLPTGSPLPAERLSTGSLRHVDRKPTSGEPSGEPSGEEQPSGKRSHVVDRLPVEAFVDTYHQLCPMLPRCLALTPKRRQHIAARLRERPLAAWEPILRALAASPFHTGENDRGWRADLDWLTRNSENGLKLLERSSVPTARTRPRAMAAGGIPMRTYEESQARAAAEAAERERRRAAWEAAQAAKGATA